MIDLIRQRLIAGAVLCAGAMFATGCSSESHKYDFSEELRVPQPPPFLAGPEALLLTNTDGFSAQVTMDNPALPGKEHALTGQLLGQGSQLFFSPTKGDKSFIWDVQAHTGYMLSESMQGYAPIYSALVFTNVAVVAETAGPASERVNGHPGHQAQVTVTANDGSTASFNVWRASDFQNLPVRIETLKPAEPVVINLTALRAEKLDAKLFLPPEGFTAYSNTDAMVSELLIRKSRAKFVGSQVAPTPLPGKTPAIHQPGHY